jgi:hypothetical protein
MDMKDKKDQTLDNSPIKRRDFFRRLGSIVAGGAILGIGGVGVSRVVDNEESSEDTFDFKEANASESKDEDRNNKKNITKEINQNEDEEDMEDDSMSDNSHSVNDDKDNENEDNDNEKSNGRTTKENSEIDIMNLEKVESIYEFLYFSELE